jgi:asparagine synthase (glutamine-hydrolysing)
MLRHDAGLYSRSPLNLFAQHCLKPLIPERLKALVRPFIIRRELPDFALKAIASVADEPKIPELPQEGQRAIYQAVLRGPFATFNGDATLDFFGRSGFELRLPFLDRRLIEFTFAIPQDQRWRGRISKFVLREAMKGSVPDAIRTRVQKADNSGPIWDLLLSRRDEIARLFRDPAIVMHGIADQKWVADLLDRSLNGQESLPYNLQCIVAIELWCRHLVS